MQQLVQQLGIDWRLLLSQAVNFALLLIVLRLYVYKPLLKIMHDRKLRIEEGLTKADEADRRLAETEEMRRQKMKEADAQAIALLKKTEDEAKLMEARLLAEAKRKEAEAMKSMDETLRAKEDESRRMMEQEAAALVKASIIKTVELSPSMVDDALVARAVKEAAKRS